MRNRSNTPPRTETDFIHAGSAGIDSTTPSLSKTVSVRKAKPVSISFFEDNLQDLDNIIREEMVLGNARVNRSDVVRASIEALKKLSKSDISSLIAKAKQK